MEGRDVDVVGWGTDKTHKTLAHSASTGFGKSEGKDGVGVGVGAG